MEELARKAVLLLLVIKMTANFHLVIISVWEHSRNYVIYTSHQPYELPTNIAPPYKAGD